MSAVQDSLEQAQDFIRLLRTENNALRKQVQELQNGTAHSTSKLPSYEEVDVVESLRKQCHDLQGEKQVLENEVASLKNGPCKDPSHAYDTERAEFLSKQLSDTLFLKKEQEYLLRERISELEKTCRELEEKLRGQQPKKEAFQPSTPSSSTPANVGFDVAAFLQEIQRRDAVKPRLYNGPFSRSANLKLPAAATELMPNGSMRFSLSELIWKAPGADRFLAFVPMQLLKPPGKNGEERFETGVTQRELVKRPNQRREIFFLHNHAWHYYGEYECMGTVSLTAKEVEEIGSAALVAYIEKRTLLEPQRARPGAADRIHNMYVEGKLKVQCFAFKRQSYNEPLNKLLTSKETPQSRSSQRARANADSAPTPDNLYFVL